MIRSKICASKNRCLQHTIEKALLPGFHGEVEETSNSSLKILKFCQCQTAIEVSKDEPICLSIVMWLSQSPHLLLYVEHEWVGKKMVLEIEEKFISSYHRLKRDIFCRILLHRYISSLLNIKKISSANNGREGTPSRRSKCLLIVHHDERHRKRNCVYQL